MTSYLIRVGDATSHWLNTTFLNGNINESLSGRAWRTQSRWYRVIDTLFWFDPDHCRVSHMNDMAYAREILK